MWNIKVGAKFDSYECQAVAVVVHVVSVQSFQLGSASRSFEAGFDGWLSAKSCVRLAAVFWNRDHNQQQYLFLYIYYCLDTYALFSTLQVK